MAGNKNLGGGGNREMLRPLTPRGTIQHDLSDTEIIGNHKGVFGGLNVANPQPGFAYQWERNTPRDLFLARQRGWQVVQTGDPDGAAWQLTDEVDSDRPTPLDTSDVFNDVVLVRTPEDNYRRLIEERLEANRTQLSNSDGHFLDGATDAERSTGHRQGQSVATRWASREHSTNLMEGDVVKDTVAPRGIIREET